MNEAQNIKNPETKQAQEMRKIDAELPITHSGKRVENRLSELCSIMHFLNPGYLGARTAFSENIARVKIFRSGMGLPAYHSYDHKPLSI